jgi:DNA replication protein
MTGFPGFSSDKKQAIALPAEFFTHLLAEIDDLEELKLTLYIFWLMAHQEGRIKFVRLIDLSHDEQLLDALGGAEVDRTAILRAALRKAVQRGSLLASKPADAWDDQVLFLIHSKEGEAALAALAKGDWHPDLAHSQEITLAVERPNIFTLYEQHIGALTPMISEMLQEAERMYPAGWIEDAFRAAVKNNVRRWNYVEAILKRWHEEGRSEEDRRSDQSDRKKYIQGQYGDLIEH